MAREQNGLGHAALLLTMPLPRVNVGDPIRAAHVIAICDEITRITPRSGRNVRVSSSGTGSVISVDLPEARGGGDGGGGVPDYDVPFKVVLGYPADPQFPVVRIHGESYIQILETGALYTITGEPPLGAILGSAQDDENDPGQFPLPEVGQSIWLEATVSGYEVTSISIWTGLAGVDGWLNYPDPVEILPPDEQNPYAIATKSRIIVAHVVDAVDPRHGDVYSVAIPGSQNVEQRKILQQLKSHLAIQVLMMRGVPTPMLIPWSGPFIVT